MNARFTRQLRNNATLRLLPGRDGVEVTSRSGTFLVTQERDRDDHLLESGGHFRATGRGLVVVLAMSDGAVEVGDGAGPGATDGDSSHPWPPSPPQAA